MVPSAFLTPAFQVAQDKLTEKQAIPVVGIFPSVAKAVLSLAQIVSSLVLSIFFGLTLCISFLRDITVVWVCDSLKSTHEGLKGLGFSLANLATFTALGYALKNRTQKLTS